MKTSRLSLLYISGLLLVSCEKEINLDYHETAEKYVVEARMTQDNTIVRLSTTQPVTDNDSYQYEVAGAVMVLSSDGEVLDTLSYEGRGRYFSKVKGIFPNTYTLDIEVEGHRFSSQSTMQRAPRPSGFRFVWKEMVGRRILFAELKIDDIPGEVNYYFMHIYRNGIGYRWAVLSDEHGPGQELQQLFHCCSEDDIKDGDSDALQENTRVTVEIRSIDRRSYDYFYSMQTMSSAGTNPIQNFSGGCLGYFSAYNVVELNEVFHLDEVEE